ncbi:MAG: hypothetical protein AAFX85_04520 [Pseudomonadota bacterium]
MQTIARTTTNVLATLTASAGAALALADIASAADLAVPVPTQTPQAVTLWWVIFNNPDACDFAPGAPEQCGAADLFGQEYLDSVANGTPDPALISPNVEAGIGVVHGTGGVTSARGNLRLVSTLYRSPEMLDLNGPTLIDPMGFGRAYDTPGAEIHFVVRTHGDVERGDVFAQVANFLDPYCSDPNLGYFAGDNLCADVQFAVFGANESGEDVVLPFADPANPVAGARATMMRTDDALQVVLETRVPAIED